MPYQYQIIRSQSRSDLIVRANVLGAAGWKIVAFFEEYTTDGKVWLNYTMELTS